MSFFFIQHQWTLLSSESMAAAKAPPSSKKEPPLVELLTSLRKDKYKFSKEEAEVLTNCNGRMKTYGVEGFLAAGSTVWAVTGSLKLIQRLTATVAGATAGGMFLIRWSAGLCMKDILALEGSPVQERFATILQKEALHKPRIRSLLEKYYYIEPLYDDSGQNTPGVVLRKRESADKGFEKSFREEEHSSEESGSLQTVHKTSTTPDKLDKPKESEENTTTNSSKIHGSTQAHVPDEICEDPFDMLLGSEPTDEPSKLAVKGKAVEKHKAKIGVLERRERNRARYLEWQEKRNASGWGDTIADL